MSKMKRIKTNEEYLKALSRFEEIFNAEEDSKEGEEAFLLGLVIGAYEDDNFPIADPDPIDYIDARLDAMGLKRKDLEGVIAKGRAHVSEVMNRKRALSLEAIRALEDQFNMDPKILIKRYRLKTSSPSLSRKPVIRGTTLARESSIPYKSASNNIKSAPKRKSVSRSKSTPENPNVKESSPKSGSRTKSGKSKEN
jgi:HTH-type transcriptional regulator/antitoxin HigA